MTYKIGDKLKLLTSFYEDTEYSKSVSKGSVLDVVQVCRTKGQWIDQTSVGLAFLYPPYSHGNEFELAEEEKVNNKFAAGDKVILAAPQAASGHDLEEGWIGYVIDPNDPVQVAEEKRPQSYYYFNEDELELLSVGSKEKIQQLQEEARIIFDGLVDKDQPFNRDDITPQDIAGISKSALDKQIGGGHYKEKGIQPIEYIFANNLGFCEANIVKYATRWKDKNGIQDLEKIIHYSELLIELTKKEELKDKEGK